MICWLGPTSNREREGSLLCWVSTPSFPARLFFHQVPITQFEELGAWILKVGTKNCVYMRLLPKTEEFYLTLSSFADYLLVSKAKKKPIVKLRKPQGSYWLNIFELWDTLNLRVCSRVEESCENVAGSVNIPRHLKVTLLGFVAISLSIKETYSSCRGVSGIKAF